MILGDNGLDFRECFRVLPRTPPPGVRLQLLARALLLNIEADDAAVKQRGRASCPRCWYARLAERINVYPFTSFLG